MTFIAALVTAVAMICRGPRSRAVVIVVGGILVLVVAWARLYVGVHDLPDVVGGVLNGVAGVVLFAGLWNLTAARLLLPGAARSVGH